MSAEELARLSQNQLHLYENVRKTARRRANAAVRAARLTPAQRQQIDRAKERLNDARLVINLDLMSEPFGIPIIDSLIESEKLYNIFEIELAARDVNPQLIRLRLMSEFKIYGATPDAHFVLGRMSNTEHPNYGSLDYIGDPIAFSSSMHYGWHRLRLKRHIEQRCTFTPADSFMVRRNQVFTWDTIDGILATHTSFPPRFWFEFINQRREPFTPEGVASYIEFQVLGGVWLQDIDLIYYPSTQRFNREFFARFERLHEERGIELVGY